MVYRLNATETPERSCVGGKAKSLMEMKNHGLPVPDGFVLTVNFLKPWMDKILGTEHFTQLLESTTKNNCDSVKKHAASLKFTTHQRFIFDNYKYSLHGSLFAVRSSSPDEDQKNTSFAGMYDTHLGVNETELEKTVAKVFSSCFDYRVIEYKKRNGFDITETSMAIIIQQQISSEISGVGFSINPLNNCYDEVLINASFGLGETIVSGNVTPDLYIYDSENKTILEKKINSKDVALWISKKGKVIEEKVVGKNKQALTDDNIIRTSNLVKTCEKYYGVPTDIEWAYSNGQLYLLQSRPITGYIPLFKELRTRPGEKRKYYIDGTILTQGFDKQMSVLGLEIWSAFVNKAKLGMLSPHINGTAPAINGRHYINVTSMLKLIGKKGTSGFISRYDRNIKKIFSNIDYLSHLPGKAPHGSRDFRFNIFKTFIKTFPELVKVVFGNYKSVIDRYKKNSDLMMNEFKNISKDDDIKKCVSRIYKHYESVIPTITALFIGVIISKRNIKRLFNNHDIENEIEALSMNIKGNPTSAMGHLLYKMARYKEFKNTSSKEEFIRNCVSENYSYYFIKDYKEFMEKYAVRGLHEIDIASKRVTDDIGILYDKLSEINTEDNRILNLKIRREFTYNRLLNVAIQMDKGRKFIEEVKKYQDTFSLREHPKYLIVYVIAMLRKHCLNIADNWVKEGRLKNPNQIFDLHVSDISKAQNDPDFNIMQAREKNLAGYNEVSNVKNWPLVIDSRGKIYTPGIDLQDGYIAGDPIAPGKITGRAKVLKTPYEKPINPGEILVTRATEPAWTPVFINASGVVMEIGGPLQHGGIIAREYGIPCVSGLLGIMDMVKDGDLLEINGYTGVIRILESINK